MKKVISVFLSFVLLFCSFAFADDLSDEICGRWAFYWDTRPMNEKYNGGKKMMSFVIQSYDLYLLDDYTAYLNSVSSKYGTFLEMQQPTAEGSWNDYDGHLTLYILDNTYSMDLDDKGRLLVYFSEKAPYPFLKVEPFDFFAEY